MLDASGSDPDAQTRVSQADHNYHLYEHLKSDGRYLDWGVTLLFYTAVQLVDAYAAKTRSVRPGFPFFDHRERRGYISRYLRSIQRMYRQLEDGSRDARYEARRFTQLELEWYHDVAYKHIEGQLRNRGIVRRDDR